MTTLGQTRVYCRPRIRSAAGWAATGVAITTSRAPNLRGKGRDFAAFGRDAQQNAGLMAAGAELLVEQCGGGRAGGIGGGRGLSHGGQDKKGTGYRLLAIGAKNR